jgi:hypothetical protein
LVFQLIFYLHLDTPVLEIDHIMILVLEGVAYPTAELLVLLAEEGEGLIFVDRTAERRTLDVEFGGFWLLGF